MKIKDDREVVLEFLRLHEPSTFDDQLAMLAEDAVYEAPFRNARVVGKENIIAGSKQGIDLRKWTKATFVDIKILATETDGLFVVTCGGDMIVPKDRVYKNKYVFFIQVTNGQISLFHEYFDTEATTQAFS